MGRWWAQAAAQLVGPAALALVALGLRAAPVYAALLAVLVVLLASTVGGLWSGVVTAALAATIVNGVLRSPARVVTMIAPPNGIALVVFLVVAVVASQLVARVRARARQAEARADQTRRLLTLSEQVLARIAAASDVQGTLNALAGDIGRALSATRADIFLWDPDGPLDGAVGPASERLRAACRVYPDGPLHLAAAAGLPALCILPLARHGDQPALLVLEGGETSAAMVGAVVGLASLAVERLLLLRQVTLAEAARASDQLKSALLASVSHELRTPLAAIRVAATALQRSDVWADDAGREDLLRTVDEEAERLNRVIANLLCMSRIEAGALALDRHPCEVETLVWEGMRQAGLQPERRRVRLHLPEGLPEVDAEPGLAGLALANLMSNAVKYAPGASTVEIGARLARGGGLVAVWVDDRGPGIPPGEAERIFERFYRGPVARGSRGAPPGTGLGLSIARALVEAHGGRLWVEARPGGGSRFTATWPVAVARADDGRDASVARAGHR